MIEGRAVSRWGRALARHNHQVARYYAVDLPAVCSVAGASVSSELFIVTVSVGVWRVTINRLHSAADEMARLSAIHARLSKSGKRAVNAAAQVVGALEDAGMMGALSGMRFIPLAPATVRPVARHRPARMNAALETLRMYELLRSVGDWGGVQARFGPDGYTITVWENVDGGYDVVYTAPKTDIAHKRETGLNFDETLVRMRDFASIAADWQAVEYGA
jgi:hypothetical protein